MRLGRIVYPENRRRSAEAVQVQCPDNEMNWRSRNLRLAKLEAEAIHILREAIAEFRNPVMLLSVGKDSSAMLHIAQKAFAPAKPPFPLLHIDTTWKFREMIAFRDETAKRLGMNLLVHANEEGLRRGISPVEHGSAVYTQVMKTEGLRQALDRWKFDVALGGARRDEEKSRAKERIFSHRSPPWLGSAQSTARALEALQYAHQSRQIDAGVSAIELDRTRCLALHQGRDIPVVPLYFAKDRPVVERNGTLIMVDDHRLPLLSGETPQMVRVRFRHSAVIR